jgi:8-hydroxy-5-deazaflavin:NADPH oxidoreductase
MIIGFLGAGQMAQTLARVWLRAGHQVLLANSRGPESLAGLVAELGPGATAVTPPELRDADVIVLATRWAQLPAAVPLLGPLDGKIVVDPTNNFVDDKLVDLGGRTSSEVVAELVPSARLVKGFNHLLIKRLGMLRDYPEPLALYLAGDDPAAKAVVAGLVRDLGGVPVDTGRLVEGGRRTGSGGILTGYDHPLTGAEAEAVLAGAGGPRGHG